MNVRVLAMGRKGLRRVVKTALLKKEKRKRKKKKLIRVGRGHTALAYAGYLGEWCGIAGSEERESTDKDQ